MMVEMLSTWFRRWQIIGGFGLVVILLLATAAIFIHQHQAQPVAWTSAIAGVCAPKSNATVTASITPPDITLPITIPPGEPHIVATVNGEPLYAEALEVRVEGTIVSQQKALQQAQQTQQTQPPNIQASLERTPNQIRHDALTRMIQECLLLQEGKRLGLTASQASAQVIARQQLHLIQSLPASDQARVSFEAYLRVNHLTEQTFLTNPGILDGYRDVLTMAAVEQHIRNGLPPGESPTAGVNAYIQHLWQAGQVHVYLPAQLGW
jgi:SurA-like N-terminal domain